MRLFPYPAQALLDPLDADTIISLVRLRVIAIDGSLEYEGLAALATVIGSEIYELLESECCDSEHMTMLLRSMKDCETQFLFLCLMYGEFGVNIPEPLIMLASHRPALTEFVQMLINELDDISDKDSLLDPDDLLTVAVMADINKYYIEKEKMKVQTKRKRRLSE